MTIISASRRTDMPAFYPDEIMHEVNQYLQLEGLVLWTKNPEPFIHYLDKLDKKEVPYYFQYTVNDYGVLEPGIPMLEDRINTFINLSKRIGKERVIWRFDPILLTDKISIDDIATKFKNILSALHPYTEKVVFSYVDIYPKIDGRGVVAPSLTETEYITRTIANECFRHKLKCATCSESFNIPNVEHNRCIDSDLLNRISGNNLTYKKDASQRKTCGCAKSIDIGEYHTCKHGCKYCYAN